MEKTERLEGRENFQSKPDLPLLTSSTRVVFIRHGAVDLDWEGRIYGQMDAPLSTEGRRQSDKLLFRLRSIPFAAVYSSDLSRARYTGESLVRLLGIAHVKDERLRERHYGEWQGRTWEEVGQAFPAELAAYDADRTQAPPAGESLAQVRTRVMPLMDEIARRHVAESIAVVSHAGVVRTILVEALGLVPAKAFSFQLKHCSVSIVDYRNADRLGCADAYIALLNG